MPQPGAYHVSISDRFVMVWITIGNPVAHYTDQFGGRWFTERAGQLAGKEAKGKIGA